MSFAHHLQCILQKLSISDKDREWYTKDAVAIQNQVMNDLKKVDGRFNTSFDGLSLGGSYLDRTKLKTPDEFDMHMKLKFPVTVTPKIDPQRKGFVFLHAPGHHPAIVDNYVNRKALQNWLREGFETVFKSYNRLHCPSGLAYDIKYVARGYGCAHTIEASSGETTISFDFVPAVEFKYFEWPLAQPSVPYSIRSSWPWLAVPQQKAPQDERTFMACAPYWERELMKGSDNLKNVLRLMKGLRDGHKNDLPHLSSYMLKTVLLHQIDTVNWQRDLGTLLYEMWAKLVQHLQRAELDFYLAQGCNIFDRMSRADWIKCTATAERLWDMIYKLKQEGTYDQVLALYKL